MNIRMYDSRIAVPWTYWLALASGVAGFNHWRRLSSPMSPGIITPLWGSFRTFVGQGRCPVGGVLSGPCTPSPLGTHHRLLCARFGRTCIPALQRIRCCPGTLGPGATVWKPCHAAPSMAGNGVSPGNDATPGGQGPARRHHPLIELVQGIPTSRSPAPVFQLYLCRVHLIVLLLLYLLFSHERDGYSTRLADRETEIEKDPRIEDSRLPVPPLFTRRGISSVPWWEI